MAEEKRPSLLAILLGSGGVGGLIIALIAVAEFLGGSGTDGGTATVRPDPVFTMNPVTPPPVGTVTPSVDIRPSSPSDTPIVETQPNVVAVDYRIGMQFSGTANLLAESAAIRIDGQDAGVIEVYPQQQVDELSLMAEAGRHSYELTVVATYDYGLGPQSFNSYGTGVIDVELGDRFGVRYDGFGAAELVAIH